MRAKKNNSEFRIPNSEFIKRAAIILLVTAMLLAVPACSKNSQSDRDKLREDLYGAVELGGNTEVENIFDMTTSNFTLPYDRGEPVNLNPFTCTSTLNETVGDLIYDKLININSEFGVDMVIAQSVEIKPERPHIISVVLRSGVVFSDGALLTGDDVKYSFDKAKESVKYKDQLASVTSCIPGENTADFRVENVDKLAYMLLDFPIIKAGSDIDGRVPIGSGRYYYYSDPERGNFLLRNRKWYNTSAPKMERISLVAMPTVESIIHSIEIGTVSYYYTDLRDGYPSRINANYSTVDLNHLVFLGMNTFDPRLSQMEVREAMSLAIGREEVATNAFSGRAYSATGPFTASWPEAASVQYGSMQPNKAGALINLINSGFVNVSEDYVRYHADGRRLSFSLLVSATNAQHVAAAQSIKNQLAAMEININVYPIALDDLQNRIATGNYELYLGEYSMLSNMDITKLIVPGIGYYTGLLPEATCNAYQAYKGGMGTLGELVDAFEADLPFIPLCYRLGIVCYTRSILANMDVTKSNLFMGMEMWENTQIESPADITGQ